MFDSFSSRQTDLGEAAESLPANEPVAYRAPLAETVGVGVAPLRAAARTQAPASLRIQAEEARRLSFVSSVSTVKGRTHVRLSPIAGPLEPGAPATLDFRCEGRELFTNAVVESFSGNEAVLAVSTGVRPRANRTDRVVPELDSTLALFVADQAGLGRSCLPVLDIGLQALRVLSAVPFQPGTVLRRLQVLKNRRLVREAEGVVLTSSPALRPDCETVYDVRVELRAPTQLAHPEEPADLNRVTLLARVRAILWGLSDLGCAFNLRSDGKDHPGQFQPIKGNREQLPVLRCTFAGPVPEVAGTVQLDCSLFGSGYRFYARARSAERALLLMPAPLLLETHRRDEERLSTAEGLGATVEYIHPVDGTRRTRSILDLSAGGFSIQREPADDVIWPGLPLDDVRLRVGDQQIHPSDVTVRNVGAHRVGFSMGKLPGNEVEPLRLALMEVAAKPIELDDGSNLDPILDFHRAVNLFEPDMARNLEASLEATREGWRKAHAHPDRLMRTAFLRWKDGIGATLNLVRAYESTWVMQHMAVASPSVPGNLGMLYSTLLRLTVPRADGQYVCGFIADDAKSQHSIMKDFFTGWSSPEYRDAANFVLYSAKTREPRAPAAGARKLRQSEEALVENAANRIIPGLCARALELREGRIRIRSTAKAFGQVGLERGREAWGSFDRKTCKAVLVREWASPGLSLSSLLSASILLPIDSDGAGIAGLVDVMLREPIPGDPEVRFLLVPESADGRHLEAAGMKRVAGCTLYAMHRYGLCEYQRYVANRYGFLHGRMRARTEAMA